MELLTMQILRVSDIHTANITYCQGQGYAHQARGQDQDQRPSRLRPRISEPRYFWWNSKAN